MKKFLTIVLVIVFGVIMLFFVLGNMSQSGAPTGLVLGSLSQCSNKPNCVCSEQTGNDPDHYIDPIALDGGFDPRPLLIDVLEDMGGSIEFDRGDYLAFTFTSKIFKFVDDLEIRIDVIEQKIHVRSSSRVGYSDRGVNRARVETLKRLYSEKVTSAN